MESIGYFNFYSSYLFFTKDLVNFTNFLSFEVIKNAYGIIVAIVLLFS